MAKANDVPENIRKRLTAAELKARLAYAGELEADADRITDPEMSRGMRGKAQRVLGAKPILELKEELAACKRAIEHTQATGPDAASIHADYRETIRELKDGNPQAPDLELAIDRQLEHGVQPSDINLNELLAEPATKGSSGSRASGTYGADDGAVVKARIKREIATLGDFWKDERRKTAELMAELQEFKRQRGIQ